MIIHGHKPAEFEKYRELMDVEKGILRLAVLLRGLAREVVQQSPIGINDFTPVEQDSHDKINTYLDGLGL